MKLLGVTLETPNGRNLLNAASAAVLVALVVFVASSNLTLAKSDIQVATCGVLGVLVARIYGVAMERHGWRGTVISMAFGALFYGLGLGIKALF
ncbi:MULTISPECIES: hypothetical protein [Gulbenkiania]|uniref:Uncharacterized protein n=2 Tax=Gulbenkiania TaxID=397456 RepID=A0A0K6H4T9_9NEIS|nr:MULTISPECIES: hypothetical protein [Gulbenkiania]TCW30371.1 hypothetical protein EV669_107131 [Gulbenkiania mobilis]CUA85842.1 hypothetical protein Ga0061063_2515 [Gulbenkiania indica]